MASASQPSSATPVDPPEITQSTAPTWPKLINLRSASPAEYLLSVLQNIMRSQETLVLKVGRFGKMMKPPPSRQSSNRPEDGGESVDNDSRGHDLDKTS
ncbi:hypothetical protein VE02_03116 [Pseudogymnoascus sp. 03VT05]|nr:hypothetical protein VE02_03116 [Pseudogymnoascus sp. 03VT05]